MQADQTPYKLKNPVRILTAGSLFDGHDVSINIMRQILQQSGAEVIHLGHNRSAGEIVNAAIQEDVHAIALTSYQGGHMEFFKYIYDLLREQDGDSIKVFGGGGGTILLQEIEELHDYGIDRLFSPDDGREMGLQGMINEVLSQSDYNNTISIDQINEEIDNNSHRKIGQIITSIANGHLISDHHPLLSNDTVESPLVLGITGTGGAGKSSLVDELILRFNQYTDNLSIAIVSIDPTKRKSGGALLGDRIRMNAINSPNIYMRSLATRNTHHSISGEIGLVIRFLKKMGFDLIILETSGIGQSDTCVVDYSDVSLYVMTPDFGAPSQLEKIDMLDYADVIAINKFDKMGSNDALRYVKRQYQRNHHLWENEVDEMPVFGTCASKFNDRGVDQLFKILTKKLNIPFKCRFENLIEHSSQIIPTHRTRYLEEIKETISNYNKSCDQQCDLASEYYAISKTISLIESRHEFSLLREVKEDLWRALTIENQEHIKGWSLKIKRYTDETFEYTVRDKTIKVNNFTETLAHQKIPKISLPNFRDYGDILKWILQENVPGEFPYTAGVFPFKRQGEMPTRMFAGEGEPERTNQRFHYLSKDMPAKRLSTAFDSVTLYGEDPAIRPDIYGKIGNSGVTVSSLDDAKILYSGIDLCDRNTSVSMTINGPAATICAFFMNAAIDQQCEKYIQKNGLISLVEQKLKEKYDAKGLNRPKYKGDLPVDHSKLGLLLLGLSGNEILDRREYNKIKEDTLQKVRGTVQADILKEDQAQNTCIFSTEFSLRLMGDVQQYFIDHKVKNFYSVSISGYHIAEAGANPISQLAFTLSNGFTFVEYYLSRGMHIDDFAPNLSFFFSNGIDPEYAVIGRVGRRIWAKAIKLKYGGNERSQKLKYHIQTSGRSLHAQEIDFNDIRTTLQALYAVYDNCNSLHTNAYDEAITTPTEESVRRAMAIQLIINQELGLTKNENPLQGSFIIEELTNLVEEAVMVEFSRINDRGGVLGAMESMYQRSKIQEESMYYEHLKHQGKYPIIGVNTFLSSKGSPTILPKSIIRSTKEEKDSQIEKLKVIHQANEQMSFKNLQQLKEDVHHNNNIFESLMEVAKYCTLGQITHALYAVGGKYRRNM